MGLNAKLDNWGLKSKREGGRIRGLVCDSGEHHLAAGEAFTASPATGGIYAAFSSFFEATT